MDTSYGIKEYDTKYSFNFTSLHEIGNLTSACLKQKCTRIFSEVKLFLILSLFIPALKAEIIETSDITQITSHISQGTLVLLDIDNTIIQLTQTLGTPEWFSAFYKKRRALNISHEHAMKETVNIYLRVNEISAAKPVDLNTGIIIRNLQEQGIVILGLTSRDDSLYKATINHLKPTSINFNVGKFQDYQLKLQTGAKSKVHNGIIFSGGKHKGECLEEFLSAVNWSPKKIVFVDDQLKAIQEVESAAVKNNTDYIGVRYGYLDDKAKNLNLDIAEIQLAHLEKTGHILSDEDALSLLKTESSG